MPTATPTSIRTSRSARASQAQREISGLSEDLIRLYRSAARERGVLHKLPSARAGSLLDKTEQFADAVQGYAAWIVERGDHPNPAGAVEHLSTFRAFDLLAQAAPYPKLKRYIAFVDYLRRLLIEYLQQLQPQS
jgi:hypothetical protein